MGFTRVERLILFNQYEILKNLSKGDVSAINTYEKYQEILTDGYAHDYWAIDEIIQDELPNEKAVFVWDVLQMYRNLLRSYEDLAPDETAAIDKEAITFHGFDGNEESEYLLYAEFIIEKLKRYTESQANDYNTHCPTLNRYQQMLEAWRNLKRKKGSEYPTLTAPEICEIINHNRF